MLNFDPISASASRVEAKTQENLRKLIARFHDKQEITIPDLSEQIGTSIPKTTELVNGLLKAGLIRDQGRKTSGIGRKASLYSLTPDSFFFLGIEIRKYKVSFGLMGFDKTMIVSAPDIPFPFDNPDKALEAVKEKVLEFIDSLPVPRNKILAVGLSIPGRINVRQGSMLTFYHFGDAPVKQILEQAIGIPVYIDNDSRTLAYGEFHLGTCNPPPNTLIINLDYGMAVGIFIEGKPVYGISGYAGEIGHISIFNNEKICYCGKKGCLETESNGWTLIEYIQKKMREGSNSRLQKVLEEKGLLELEDIIDAVKLGDNLALEGISVIAYQLGKGLSVMINLLNPGMIILAGLISGAGEPLLLPIQSAIYQYSLSIVSSDTKVTLSTLNERAGLHGACLLVRDKVLGLV